MPSSNFFPYKPLNISENIFYVRDFLSVLQVSSHTAKRIIAESSQNPRDFLKKYEELKSKK